MSVFFLQNIQELIHFKANMPFFILINPKSYMPYMVPNKLCVYSSVIR